MKTVNASKFVKSKKLTKIIRNLLRVYSITFESGDEVRGKVKLLESISVLGSSKNDFFWLGLKIGAIVVLGIWSAYTLFATADQLPHQTLYVFRGLGCCIIAMWLWGLNIWTWGRFRINYVFLFEFDPRTRLTFDQVWSEAATWSIVFLMSSLAYMKSAPVIPARYLVVIPAALYSFFILRIFCPWIFPHWKSRKCLLSNTYQCVIAPFGLVRFRHFYTGDVLTSLVKVLADLYMASCLLILGEFNLPKGHGSCHNSKPIGIPIVISLPYWFRLAQCLKQVWDTGERFPYSSTKPGERTKARKSLMNAFKYLLCLTITLMGALHSEFSKIDDDAWNFTRIIWLVLTMTSTLYSYSWDIFMDWDLSGNPWKPRDPSQLMFGNTTYALAMVVDLVLRFAWSFTLLPTNLNPYFEASDDVYFVFAVATLEIFRRSLWGIFRLEHAHLDNKDEFRKYNYVPVLFDNDGTLTRKPTEGLETGVLVEIGIMVMVVVVIICLVVST